MCYSALSAERCTTGRQQLDYGENHSRNEAAISLLTPSTWQPAHVTLVVVSEREFSLRLASLQV